VAEEHDIVGEIVDLAEKMNIPIEFISKETSAGFGFYGTFRGLGAFLRYK
jgi:peptide subunit release factor 1 (eRF1)